MVVGLPLVEDGVAHFWAADGVEHVTIALAVNAFLKSLDVEAQVHFVGRDILADARQVVALQGIQEDQEAQDFVVGFALSLLKVGVVLDVLREIDFLWNPEVVHSLAVPVAGPVILHIVEVVEVRGVATYHPAQSQVGVTIGIEQFVLPFREKVVTLQSMFPYPRPIMGRALGNADHQQGNENISIYSISSFFLPFLFAGVRQHEIRRALRRCRA